MFLLLFVDRKAMEIKMKKTLDIAMKKTLRSIREIGDRQLEYGGCADGNYFDVDRSKLRELGHIFSWTQSFFTGMAGISYKVTHNPEYLKWLYSAYDQFYDKVFVNDFETMHDLGFLYSPYAVMTYRITGDDKMKKIAVAAADALLKRYVPNGHYIRAWGRMDNVTPPYVDAELAKDHFFTQSNGLAIIDCMMNLPILFFASSVTGHPTYKNVAIEHIETTLKYFIRDDYSNFHAYRFNPETGEPMHGDNFCGYGVDTYWARGTSWLMYGLVIAYSYTKNEKYLDIYEKVTEKFISECRENGMPEWDFRLPADKPMLRPAREGAIQDTHEECILDTSAAAVAVCAAQQFLKFRKNDKIEAYKNTALNTLVTKYFNTDENVCGMLHHVNGQMVYASYADYYFMEALATELYDMETCW